jgi:hypothetical protein
MFVNTHIHSPYSFSSFDSIEQAVVFAKEENVGVLGINDFGTVEGYPVFADICKKYGIYPLFNIEFATLIEEDRIRQLRWNDIANPGIMYFCGKALNYPPLLSGDSKNLLGSIWKGSQDRIWKMLSIINDYLRSLSLDTLLDYQNIRAVYAKQAVRERHIAKALYMSFVEKWNDPSLLLQKFRYLFQEESFSADLADSVVMQNEIRSRLLKPGKVGYVDENYESCIRLYEAKSMVLSAGGIPCYPFFLDSAHEITETEKDIVVLERRLNELGIYAVEFISNRVPFDCLKNYVRFFNERGYCVSFGTEHCTPERYSLVPGTQGGRPFDSELERIAFEGAAIYAAHQELHKQNRPGYVDESGNKLIARNRMREFIRIGEEAIRRTTQQVITCSV